MTVNGKDIVVIVIIWEIRAFFNVNVRKFTLVIK